LLDATLRGAPLFPASLAGGLPNSEMLFVTLVGNARDTLFRSEPRRLQRNATIEAKVPVDLARTAPVAEPLGDAFRDLRVVVALDPDAAPWIDANTLPGRGLRYVAGVLVFTVALIGVAIHQLRRQQELVRLRAGFVSGVSHELRTPLAQIRLFADLLESGQLSDEQRRRASQIINSESQRLGYLVENVLRFSRSERAVERINLVPVDLSVLADDIALTLAPLVAARGATIERIGAAGIEALADPDALRQVIINLLDNAAKYGPPGQRIRIGVEGDGVHARVWVDDEGPGIPSGAREIVWAPFRRLERDVEAASGGSGIGLSVVREIVRLHGGDARITDAPGGGARVVITLAALASNGAEVSA
ncbi:MAG: sensor histidine kinase, partial [Longimicrobiales bacterium]